MGIGLLAVVDEGSAEYTAFWTAVERIE